LEEVTATVCGAIRAAAALDRPSRAIDVNTPAPLAGTIDKRAIANICETGTCRDKNGSVSLVGEILEKRIDNDDATRCFVSKSRCVA
jgi:hypothetical protein